MTGILLALVYTPSASHAWSSLQFLDHNVKLGWFLRAMHGWGSDFMIAIVLIHMAQVFLFGAYKFPRELTWIIGVFLLLLTLGMAFTGQVLRFDQDAYWGLGIGASIVSRVPVIGGQLVDLMLGGPIIAGPTLSRFFALHVFVIPGILLALVGLHLWMVLRLGINEWPMPGRLVRKSTYVREYHELTKEDRNSVRSRRRMEGRDLCCGHHARRHRLRSDLRPIRPYRPARSHDHPDRPQARLRVSLDLCRPGVSAAEPGNACSSSSHLLLGIGCMLLLPLIAGEGEKHWSRRPVAVLMVAVIAVTLGIFTRLGTYTPWSPIMDAWTSDPIPATYLHDRTPLETAGRDRASEQAMSQLPLDRRIRRSARACARFDWRLV